jgi:hypothetical protein
VARHHLIGQCLVQVLSLAATTPALTILATLCGDRFGRHGCGATTVGVVKAGSEPNNPLECHKVFGCNKLYGSEYYGIDETVVFWSFKTPLQTSFF